MKEFNPNYLDFEQPLLDLENKIQQINDDPDKTAKSDSVIEKLNKDHENLTKKIVKFYPNIALTMSQLINNH